MSEPTHGGLADINTRINRLTIPPSTTDEQHRARLTCAHHATSPDDLRQLLAMLGLAGDR